MLSQVVSLFDPLGLPGPVIVKAKIMLQKLWEIKLDWDESSEKMSQASNYMASVMLARVRMEPCYTCDLQALQGSICWLANDEFTWPSNLIPTIEIPEQRSIVVLANVLDIDINLLTRFSSFNKMKRIIAYCLRFSANCRSQKKVGEDLNTEELKEAEMRIIKLVQLSNFENELRNLNGNRILDKKSNMLTLNPYVDEIGILRVGGRLKHAELEFDQKHPILLPSNNHITELIIRETHVKLCHAGSQATLYAIRQKYWLLNGCSSGNCDLTTEAFIASLKRCFADRGKARMMQSDNGTNLVGASNNLKELFKFLEETENQQAINRYLVNEGIQWSFIPPRSPHFGGIWEASVKSFKHHMRRTVGDALFTFEEFNTFVIEIETILNSRPLTPMSADPNDPLQHIQKVKQHFWERWNKEYLNELQQRAKWISNKTHGISIGDFVILKEDNTPPLHWVTGKVIAAHPGDDDVVRVVTVKTATGVYKRCVKKVSPLPIT
ncbi:uncharacterized protein [Polyergus mexicanus]|uniref:uncharacterized protein n=1 Tax=Polyergus mexicanus TaxID=615972 RepID=UPI0038B4C06D